MGLLLTETIKQRQVVEPVIGHMKTDSLLARTGLEGELGDALHAVMCGAGHNLSLILAGLRALFHALIAVLAALIHSDAPRARVRLKPGIALRSDPTVVLASLCDLNGSYATPSAPYELFMADSRSCSPTGTSRSTPFARSFTETDEPASR